MGVSHNAGNQMTQGRKLQYGYDNNGNQESRTVPGASDKSWTQTWDYENRLVKMEKVKGAEKRTVTFTYDPMGRRIGKQLTTVKNGVTKTSSWAYVYDNDNIALDVYTDETGAVTKTFYTHGAGVDEHLALERNGQFYYYHADGLGSIVNITDANRSVVQSYQYDSFGMSKPSTSFVNSYTYTGREWDKETGLYYYRARYYDPMEGRFISKDPIGFKGGINVYAYVGNNPVNFIDPQGLAQFGSRPLDNSLLSLLKGKFYHYQIWYDDGSNSGYFDDGSVRSDYGHIKNEYDFTGDPTVYIDRFLRQAERNVKQRWDKDYSTQNNNCQDYGEEVRREYERLTRFMGY